MIDARSPFTLLFNASSTGPGQVVDLGGAYVTNMQITYDAYGMSGGSCTFVIEWTAYGVDGDIWEQIYEHTVSASGQVTVKNPTGVVPGFFGNLRARVTSAYGGISVYLFVN